MKRQIISALLAGTLLIAPAGAAEAAADAAEATEAVAETQTDAAAETIGSEAEAAAQAAADAAAMPDVTIKRMGLLGVATAVQEGNPTAIYMRRTAAGIEGMGSSGSSSSTGSGQMSVPEIYQEQINSLAAAMDALEDKSGALYQAYAAQKKLLEDQLAAYQLNLTSTMVQGMAMLSQLEDQAYQLRRQADNVADMMAQTSQTLLITLQTLDYTRQGLEVQAASLDRTLALYQVQLSRGMIGSLQVETLQNSRDKLTRAMETLEVQRENMGSMIAQFCGYDGNTVVMPSALAQVTERQLNAMNYDKDLETALANSFSIWSKRNTLRAAKNSYEDYIDGSAEAVESAREALAAEQDGAAAAFQTLYQTVSDKQAALAAAQTALEQARLELKTSQVKYDRGMISQFAHQQAQDAVTTAELDVKTAQLELLTAYTQYDWAKQGLAAAAA